MKNVADFKLMSGNMMMMRNSGTVEYWSQIRSKLESSSGTEELPGTLGVTFLGQYTPSSCVSLLSCSMLLWMKETVLNKR